MPLGTTHIILPLSVVYPIAGALGAVHEQIEHVQEHLVVPHQSLSDLFNILNNDSGCQDESNAYANIIGFGWYCRSSLYKR